jgi:hypothetical protein
MYLCSVKTIFQQSVFSRWYLVIQSLIFDNKGRFATKFFNSQKAKIFDIKKQTKAVFWVLLTALKREESVENFPEFLVELIFFMLL